MNYPELFKKAVCGALLITATAAFGFAQNAKIAEPRQQTLLNGLKLLTWSDPSARKITVKLRIHSGAAFDPKDKMGVMALVGDILFPTPQAKEFFVEDLEGSIEVDTSYDYIQLTATAKTEELLSLLETLANAVTNPQITPENVALVKKARLEKIQELRKSPAYVADRAVASRLLGDFPYGRSPEGTPESLAKIDRADLLFARQRFLTADNATIAVVGNVKPEYAYRSVRQLFGAWSKADRKVPATFRQPDAPASEAALLDSPDGKSEMRFAARGLARNDKDFAAAQILAAILRGRLQNKPVEGFVVQNAHLLPGLFVFGVSNKYQTDAKDVFVNAVLSQKIGAEEFERAKSEVVSQANRRAAVLPMLADLWLDVDTYRLVSVQQEMQTAQNVSLADAQRVADELQKSAFVTVFVTKPASGALQTPLNN